jgi:hypothetical protein
MLKQNNNNNNNINSVVDEQDLVAALFNPLFQLVFVVKSLGEVKIYKATVLLFLPF